mmetsp:Transcript_10072/g.21520  ORF Transcript_10072/g.21520 Transcript_10072/m.21520 type:complete len:209 (-) Transcript_10072:316-942(-)
MGQEQVGHRALDIQSPASPQQFTQITLGGLGLLGIRHRVQPMQRDLNSPHADHGSLSLVFIVLRNCRRVPFGLRPVRPKAAKFQLQERCQSVLLPCIEEQQADPLERNIRLPSVPFCSLLKFPVGEQGLCVRCMHFGHLQSSSKSHCLLIILLPQIYLPHVLSLPFDLQPEQACGGMHENGFPLHNSFLLSGPKIRKQNLGRAVFLGR